MSRIPDKIRKAVSRELEDRIEETESYLDITQQDRADLHTELTSAIAAEVSRQIEQSSPDTVASAAADAAIAVIEASTGRLKRRALERVIESTVQSVMVRRLDEAAAYLRLLEAGRSERENRLGWTLTELFRERLDACEDWITLDLTDWARIRAIVLPERSDTPFRRYAVQTLALWGKFCRTILPESYDDPATAIGTAELPGTWGKVDVMEFRRRAGLNLFSDQDAVLADDQGFVAPQSLADEESGYKGNGKKDARTIDGVPVEKQIVSLRGGSLVPPTPEEEWASSDWWKLRPPTPKRRKTRQPMEGMPSLFTESEDADD